jgi:hypothetical protein
MQIGYAFKENLCRVFRKSVCDERPLLVNRCERLLAMDTIHFCFGFFVLSAFPILFD